MVAGEAESGNAPAADVAKLQGPARSNDARQGSAAGVGCAKNAADARSRDARDRNAVLLENLKDAEVGKAARKSAAKSDADTWPCGQWRRTECSAVRFTYHARSIAILRCSGR